MEKKLVKRRKNCSNITIEQGRKKLHGLFSDSCLTIIRTGGKRRLQSTWRTIELEFQINNYINETISLPACPRFQMTYCQEESVWKDLELSPLLLLPLFLIEASYFLLGMRDNNYSSLWIYVRLYCMYIWGSCFLFFFIQGALYPAEKCICKRKRHCYF